MIFGLNRTEGIIPLFVYILPEVLVLSFLWAQQFAEILNGVHEMREIELEDIQEAKQRFVRSKFSTYSAPSIRKTSQEDHRFNQRVQERAYSEPDLAPESP